MTAAARSWPREATVYQIYPRSFDDSDGDGVGDIPGIVERIDYIDDLGADVVWLCPVYDSPQVDNGYDIRDYRSINPEYGTLSDWERLRDALHEQDIRLVMDLVVNHTSAEHEWFRRSRRKEGEYADYYHWVEGPPDERPNNWESMFGGPAWSYDEQRDVWYLPLFDEWMPDLDWTNPDVRESIYEMIEWWLEKGIDDFRLDVIKLVWCEDCGLDAHSDIVGAWNLLQRAVGLMARPAGLSAERDKDAPTNGAYWEWNGHDWIPSRFGKQSSPTDQTSLSKPASSQPG